MNKTLNKEFILGILSVLLVISGYLAHDSRANHYEDKGYLLCKSAMENGYHSINIQATCIEKYTGLKVNTN